MASNTPTYNVLDNFGLHHSSLVGDHEGVRRALRDGADVNSLDAAGRTAVMCAVAGENWQNMDACDASIMSPKRLATLKTLLSHPDINLLTLNAPHQSMNGVIPLCMAAWLNQPQAVRALLNDSADSVSVDGMDSHGATALMYAARDGNLEVVQILLSHGARPDFRDRNHRTSVQFSLSHPHILWLCETVLRRHRWRQSKSADRTRLSADAERLVDLANASIHLPYDLQPPALSQFTPETTSALTAALVSSIRASDLSSLRSLLFASAPQSDLFPTSSVPVLVNLPDSKGWSPVHYCVATPQPSIQILDALYCAGADVSLFTLHEKHTTLHILARCVQTIYGDPDTTHSLHDFCLHLIQDLRAPLSARDEDDETCIHIAAEHGHSADLLMLFLDCDTTGVVRQMKNSRGLTPQEVAKTEFLYAFGIDKDGLRPTSALSNRTIRPTDSFASLSSISEINTFPDTSSLFSAENVDIDYTIQQLLSNLRATSVCTSHSTDPAHIDILERQVHDAQQYCTSIAVHFRARIEEVSRVVQDLLKNTERIDSVRNGVALASSGKLTLRGIAPVQPRKRNRDSEDSQLTFVDHNEVAYHFPSVPRVSPPATISTATQTCLLSIYTGPASASRSTPALSSSPLQSPESPTRCGLWEIESELKELELQAASGRRDSSESPTKAAMKLKQVMKKRKKLEDKIQGIEEDLNNAKKDSSFSTSRIKAWLKRMVVHHHASSSTPSSPTHQQAALDPDTDCNVGREVKVPRIISTPPVDPLDSSIDNALRTSKVVLDVAQRDLQSISQCLESAEQFIDMANHSISRTQRVVKRAIKKRELMITDLRAAAASQAESSSSNDEFSPGLLGYAHAISSRPSMASISTIYSVSSTASSVAATLTENDDEDVRIIRRLLLRKMEAQTSGAWDEVDKVTSWLQIVKEAVRSVKRRAYL
ncbi:ankyrin repeat-containing domain protein [Pholiota molesta]|nr:ankyrin repeat-containing domain protein [Pholiota molesta]